MYLVCLICWEPNDEPSIDPVCDSCRWEIRIESFWMGLEKWRNEQTKDYSDGTTA